MENKEKIAYINQLHELCKQLLNKREHIVKAQYMAYRITCSYVYTGVKAQGHASKAEISVDKVEQLKQQYNELYLKYIKKRDEIHESLKQMETPKYRQLIILRYIKRLKWRDIADKLGVSVDYAKSGLNKKALYEFNPAQ